MVQEVKFRKVRILLVILISILMLIVSLSFVFKPEIYTRELSNNILIKILGALGIIHHLALTYTLFQIYSRKYAFLISDNFFIDNSRYESLGKIEWKNINSIQRISGNCIQIYLDYNILQNCNVNLLKKYLLFMKNWNYKNSIIISCTLTEYTCEKLFYEITCAIENQKN